MVDRDAVIVGGGIGGLAAAVALHRAGWQVEVRERAPAFSEVGAGLSLWPNALRALDLLGLREETMALSAVEAHGGVRDRWGRWLARTSSAELERRFGNPMLMVHRAELHRILREALPPGALRSGIEVTQIPEASLVVAADGLNSAIRQQLWPGSRPRYAGHTAWRMITQAPVPLTEGAVTWGCGERFGFAMMSGGRVYCFATANVPAGSASPDGEYAELCRRFASWPDPIPALLAATSPDAVLRNDVYDLPRLPTFAAGRVALLGDAAHAMTPSMGQGACQSLEDAVTLAECVTNGSDIPAALTRYDQLRRRRTQAIVTQSARLNAIGQLSWPPFVALRNIAVKLAPANVTLRSMAPILRWHM